MTFFDPFIHHEFSFFLSMILRNAIKEILGEPKDTCKESFILFNKERTNLESTPREVAGQKEIHHCSEMEAVMNDCQQVAPYIEYCVCVSVSSETSMQSRFMKRKSLLMILPLT